MIALLYFFLDHGAPHENDLRNFQYFQCPDCGKTFSSKNGLQIHIGKRHPSGKTPVESEMENPESDLGMVSQNFYKSAISEGGL